MTVLYKYNHTNNKFKNLSLDIIILIYVEYLDIIHKLFFLQKCMKIYCVHYLYVINKKIRLKITKHTYLLYIVLLHE